MCFQSFSYCKTILQAEISWGLGRKWGQYKYLGTHRILTTPRILNINSFSFFADISKARQSDKTPMAYLPTSGECEESQTDHICHSIRRFLVCCVCLWFIDEVFVFLVSHYELKLRRFINFTSWLILTQFTHPIAQLSRRTDIKELPKPQSHWRGCQNWRFCKGNLLLYQLNVLIPLGHQIPTKSRNI